jgi:hypothetical protein
MLSKPYDNQVTRHLSDVIEHYYLGENAMPFLDVLIGGEMVQKEVWVEQTLSDNNRMVETTIIRPSAEMTKQRLIEKIKKAVRAKSFIVLMNDDFLKWEDRAYLFEHFIGYRKRAIVWEDKIEEMKQFGYDRPSLEEGFDDFTYIVS